MTIDDGARHESEPWRPPPTDATPVGIAPDDAVSTDIAVEVEKRPRALRRTWPLGYLALGVAVLFVILEGVAVYLASIGQPVAATVLGQALVVATALPLALGLLAVIRNRKRGWGIASMILSLVANPVILLAVLRFFGSI